MKKIIALVIAFAVFMSLGIVAFAEGSPEGNKKYNITITINGEEEEKILQEGDTITLIATDEEGFSFEGWNITGDYEIVEGDENSEILVIRPLGDLQIEELGEWDEGNEGEEGEKPEKPGKPNDSETSPPTGNSYIFLTLGGLFILFSGVALFARKKAK